MDFWILTTEYPPISGGGISTYCFHTGQMLVEKGHRVTVFIPDWKTKSIRTEEKEGVTLVKFKPSVKHHEYLGDEAALSYDFAEILQQYAEKAGAPNYIEAQEYNGIAYFSLQKKLLLGDYFSNTIFYVTAHAPGFLYLDYNQAPVFEIPIYWTGEMEKSVLKASDAVISPSSYLLSEIDKYIEWEEQEKKVIHNPYRIAHTEVKDYKKNDIVFFGKLIPQKGCLELLQYFKNLWDNDFPHSLRLIGGGDHFFYPVMQDMGTYLTKKYHKYIEAGLLVFEGHISPTLLETRLSEAHVIVVPSIVDNLPYTVLETMSLGKIVLASDRGGHKEIIEHNKSGFLFQHDKDGKNFSTGLKKILSLTKAETLSISHAAKQRVFDLCNYDTIYEQKIEFLSNIKASQNNIFPFVEPIEKKEINQEIEKNLEDDLLSIIIPYYNMEDYIEETVNSIKQSIYTNIEIIIVDDGSTSERSKSMLKKLADDPILKIITKSNEGLSETRNAGAKMATGQYLAFLDADDQVDNSYYDKAINILKTYLNVSFVGCWAEYFENSNISWPSLNPEPPYLLVHNMINSSALVYKTADFLSYGLNDTQFIYGMEDYDSIINMVKNGCRGVAIPEKLWFYRIRTGSIAQRFNDLSKSYLYRLLTSKHENFYAQYAKDITNILNANGQGFKIENPTRITRKPLPFASSQMMTFIKRNKFLLNIAKKIYARLRK